MIYELHPLCTLFPRLSGTEFESLCADIKNNGLRNPIVIHEGMIIDGGNRYRACVETGIEPDFVEFGGGNLVSFVLSVNLHRRHMTPGQQAAIVASAQDWANAQTVGKPKSGNVTGLDRVEDRMAQSGASDKTQRMADKVAKADPELSRQVAHGEISLPKAIRSITPQKQEQDSDHPEMSKTDFELIELKESNVSLSEENTRLKDALAANQLPEEEIQSAAEIIAELRGQVKTLEAELSAVKSTRNGLLVKVSELEKQCNWALGKLKKEGLLK